MCLVCTEFHVFFCTSVNNFHNNGREKKKKIISYSFVFLYFIGGIFGKLGKIQRIHAMCYGKGTTVSFIIRFVLGSVLQHKTWVKQGLCIHSAS